ncbi:MULTISPECIES: glycosyltransferase [unclassified Arthrobacter]|uniref:glycosyltransferase n=1 Tax=unclassified Arthrobacter TaxID=235627 RepID=UPI00210EA80E|nr:MULTISPECIES: glycosyltransferase [unclassified Arthrobacter]MCQ9163021.1 glycosyltransferase [Arthrobacter sp. STN4]
MMRRLVLLTNQYPYAHGDHVFVGGEIAALAARFDEIEVFNYTPGASAPMVDLPPNVVYGGNLYGSARSAKVRACLTPSLLARSIGIVRREFRSGRLAGHVGRFLSAVAVGMSLACDPRLRRSLSKPNAETSAYAFWGMGAGLLVPWLPRDVKNVSLRLHRYDLYEEESGYLPFRPSMFARSDRILAISESARGYLMEKYPGERLEGKIFTSRLGTAKPLEADRPLVDGSGRTIVSCSNLIAVKRVERILESLEELQLDSPLTWIHFGGGVLEDALRKRAALVDRPGLSIEIRGATPHPEIMEYYRTHRITAFVNVSASEGLPVSIMEAISYGIPVVATDVGGTAEIVGRDLKTGELIPASFTREDLNCALAKVMAAAPQSYDPRAVWARDYDGSANAEIAAALIAGG